MQGNPFKLVNKEILCLPLNFSYAWGKFRRQSTLCPSVTECEVVGRIIANFPQIMLLLIIVLILIHVCHTVLYNYTCMALSNWIPSSLLFVLYVFHLLPVNCVPYIYFEGFHPLCIPFCIVFFLFLLANFYIIKYLNDKYSLLNY